MYKQIFNLIKKYQTIIIHRHEKPDGDALGSQLGLKTSIISTFPEKNVFAVGDMVDYLKFMGEMDNISDDAYLGALVIIVDTGSVNMISDKRFDKGDKLIKIDHHLPQGEYGDVQLVNTKFESCCGLIAHMIKMTKLAMNKEVATYLYTGMVTDSGRFRFSSVSSKTFDVASYLMKYNIDTEYIYTNLYTDNLKNVLLKARMTLKFEVLDCGVAYIKNTYQDVLETGLNTYQLARSIVNNMSGIKEVNVWATFTETEDGKVVVELRSNDKNVNQIAVKYGGGGHLNASGATVDGWKTIDLIIEDLIKLQKGEYENA